MSESRVAAALVAVIAAFITWIALWAPIDGLVRLVPDDAFYYLEIARRIGAGEGSTFDGAHPTNGYHPLWLLLLVPLAPVMEASRMAGVRIALLLTTGLLLGAMALASRAASRLAPGDGHLAALWLGCTLLVASVHGMEVALAAFLAALLWDRIGQGYPTRAAGGLALGLIGAALFLARLDGVTLVAAADLVWVWSVWRRRAGLAPLVAALVVQAAAAGLYLAVNQAVFDLWVPLSGTLKATRQGGISLRWASSLLSLLGVGSAALALVLPLAGGHPTSSERTLSLLWTIALGTLGSMALTALTGGRETYNWYFVLPVLGGGALVPLAAARARELGLPRRFARRAVWGASLVLLVVAVRGKSGPTGFQDKIDRAMWLGARDVPGAVFAEGDCGLLGYLSRRPFVNLDGLTNSPAFLDAQDRGELAGWLLDSGVSAILAPTGAPERASMIARGRERGGKTVLIPELAPWDPPVADERYTLWRIVSLREGPDRPQGGDDEGSSCGPPDRPQGADDEGSSRGPPDRR